MSCVPVRYSALIGGTKFWARMVSPPFPMFAGLEQRGILTHLHQLMNSTQNGDTKVL